MTMNKWAILAAGMGAAVTAVAASGPVLAQPAEGRWQVKVMGTGVLPDGKIDKVSKDLIGLPAGSQAKANDNFVPTLAIEYYATPRFSVETICCVTQHHVNGAGALRDTRLVDHVLILPATVTFKYRVDAGPLRPYLGAGPSLFVIMGEKPGATARALGVTRTTMTNELGLALQAGVDVPLSGNRMGLSIDAKKYFVGTTARFRAADGTTALETKHSLDPWVVGAGAYVRF